MRPRVTGDYDPNLEIPIWRSKFGSAVVNTTTYASFAVLPRFTHYYVRKLSWFAPGRSIFSWVYDERFTAKV